MLNTSNVTATPLYTLSAVHQDALEVFRRFVKRDGTRAGARELVAGVSRTRSATVGDDLTLDMAGVVLVEAGGAIAVDDDVESAADGRAAVWAGPSRAVVDGAAANANIAVAGITTDDRLLPVVALDGTAVPGVTIHSDGNIRSAGATNNKKLLVEWLPPGRRPAGRALDAAAAAGAHIPVLLGIA